MKKNSLFAFISLVFFAVLLNSCASLSTMQTPGVVPEGELRWAMTANASGGDGDKISSSAEPNLEVGVRYGVAENFDIGAKINFLGAQVGAKYQFMRGDFDMAIGLEAGYQWLHSRDTGGNPDDPNSHIITLQAPLLVEYHINPYVGLAFGPKLLGIVVAHTDNRADMWNDSGFYGGIMVGLPLRLTSGVWFMPEFNIYSNFYDASKNSFDRVVWQSGVSVFFGGL